MKVTFEDAYSSIRTLPSPDKIDSADIYLYFDTYHLAALKLPDVATFVSDRTDNLFFIIVGLGSPPTRSPPKILMQIRFPEAPANLKVIMQACIDLFPAEYDGWGVTEKHPQPPAPRSLLKAVKRLHKSKK